MRASDDSAQSEATKEEDKWSKKLRKQAEKARKEEEKRKEKLTPRKSSVDQTLRYRLPIRNNGPQTSHSVRNLVKPRGKKDHLPRSTSIRIVPSLTSVQSKSEREHNAAYFFNKISPYFTIRESPLNIAKPIKRKLSWFRLHRISAEPILPRKSFHHVDRCRICLQIRNDCICMAEPKEPLKTGSVDWSDWTILVLPVTEQPAWDNTGRLDWLEELEEKSKINKPRMLEEKFDNSRELCCFPFNTFRIFSKRDMTTANFYLDK